MNKSVFGKSIENVKAMRALVPHDFGGNFYLV